MKKNLNVCLSVLLGMSTLIGNAVATVVMTTTPLTFTRLIDFESVGVLANNTAITNQFALDGILFTGSISANACGYGGYNGIVAVSGNGLGTIPPGCQLNQSNTSFSLAFSKDITSLSLDLEIWDPYRDDIFELRNDGLLVASFSPLLVPSDLTGYSVHAQFASTLDGLRRGYLNVDGYTFDEVRFTGNSSIDGSYLFFDNLRITEVPEPGTLGLLGFGLAGLGFIRRRKV